MRSFKYIGDCLAGFVEFEFPQGKVRMPRGEAVEVSDEFAKKLEKNGAFEEAKAEKAGAKPDKKAKGEK